MSKFKVGDRVRVKKVKVGTTVNNIEFVGDMRCLCGLEGTIVEVRESDNVVSCIDFDAFNLDGAWVFADEWLEAVGNKVDLAALLPRCLRVNLWCPIYGYGEVMDVVGEPSNGSSLTKVVFPCSSGAIERSFTTDGRFDGSLPSSECMLYPSAQLLTWGLCFNRVRVPYGESYFYIDSCFRVRSSLDCDVTIDGERFIMGNYFSTKLDAEAALGKILSCLNAG